MSIQASVGCTLGTAHLDRAGIVGRCGVAAIGATRSGLWGWRCLARDRCAIRLARLRVGNREGRTLNKSLDLELCADLFISDMRSRPAGRTRSRRMSVHEINTGPQVARRCTHRRRQTRQRAPRRWP
jgi:hypothetical protein